MFSAVSNVASALLGKKKTGESENKKKSINISISATTESGPSSKVEEGAPEPSTNTSQPPDSNCILPTPTTTAGVLPIPTETDRHEGPLVVQPPCLPTPQQPPKEVRIGHNTVARIGTQKTLDFTHLITLQSEFNTCTPRKCIVIESVQKNVTFSYRLGRNNAECLQNYQMARCVALKEKESEKTLAEEVKPMLEEGAEKATAFGTIEGSVKAKMMLPNLVPKLPDEYDDQVNSVVSAKLAKAEQQKAERLADGKEYRQFKKRQKVDRGFRSPDEDVNDTPQFSAKEEAEDDGVVDEEGGDKVEA